MRRLYLSLIFATSIASINGEIGNEKGHRINNVNSHSDTIPMSPYRSNHHRSSAVSSSNLNLNDELTAHTSDVCYSSADCDDCYECNSLARCVLIAGCYISCYSDEDCTRSQFCNSHHVCEEQPTTCYDTSECRTTQICDMETYQCVDVTPSPTPTGCCTGSNEYATTRCQLASDESHCIRMSSCHWLIGEYADCDWKSTEEPIDSGCCTIAVRT